MLMSCLEILKENISQHDLQNQDDAGHAGSTFRI
jgi:hypothetical protein